MDNALKVNEADTIKKKFSDVVVIRSEENGGFSAGNNIGIRYALRADFEYIMLLHNDTIVDREMISILKNQCSKMMVTAPKMLYYSEPQKIW